MLRSSMQAADVMETLDLARAKTGVDQVRVVHRPRLLSDNGPCYVSGELADYLETHQIAHTRGAPYHPMTQGKIERYHRSMILDLRWSEVDEAGARRSAGCFSWRWYLDDYVVRGLRTLDTARGKRAPNSCRFYEWSLACTATTQRYEARSRVRLIAGTLQSILSSSDWLGGVVCVTSTHSTMETQRREGERFRRFTTSWPALSVPTRWVRLEAGTLCASWRPRYQDGRRS